MKFKRECNTPLNKRPNALNQVTEPVCVCMHVCVCTHARLQMQASKQERADDYEHTN